MKTQEDHIEDRARPLRCRCGYQGVSSRDLAEHVETIARAEATR